MKTPFHFLLVRNRFEIIKKLVVSIEEKDLFAKFLKDENLIDKIKEMFVYILEEYTSYPLESIAESYCKLPIDYDYYDYDETPEEKSNREVRAKVKAYLIEIIEKLLKNNSFTKQNDFNT